MSSRSQSRKCACGKGLYNDNQTGKCRDCINAVAPTFGVQIGIPAAPVVISPEQQVQEDREKVRLRTELQDIKGKYKAALESVESLDSQLGWLRAIREGVNTTYRVQAREGLGTSEVTPIVLASDWHSEEIVKAAQVSGLNEFNLDIFEKRCTKFWQGMVRLIRMFNKDVKITTVVLGLLGDFITGQIHEAENAENNSLLPVDAIVNVQNHIIGGLDFVLDTTPYELIIVCKVGNHSRMTKKVRSASEMGHSLESLMYAYLAAYYRNEPRIKFVIDDGYHTYVDIYHTVNRFHHGHSIQYQGGIGGLYIPARKACQAWNKARKADRDFFGHFHTSLNDTMFTSNGSLIGYNSFGLRIKGDHEVPQQGLILVDKRRGYTGKWPILLE